VFESSTPKAEIIFNTVAYLVADGTVCTGSVAALSPLVVYLSCVVLSHNVLAVGFSQFCEPADLVDYYSALAALEDVGEETVCELVAEVTEVE
jgi:hypothetical protein